MPLKNKKFIIEIPILIRQQHFLFIDFYFMILLFLWSFKQLVYKVDCIQRWWCWTSSLSGSLKMSVFLNCLDEVDYTLDSVKWISFWRNWDFNCNFWMVWRVLFKFLSNRKGSSYWLMESIFVLTIWWRTYSHTILKIYFVLVIALS